MKVLMLGVDETRRGGMWTVVQNYLANRAFCERTGLCYLPTITGGSALRRLLFFIKAYFRARSELRRGGYDIVHMHLSERGSLYRKDIIQKLARRYGCKTVIHMHGADFETWYRGCSPSRQAHIRKVLAQADSILILGRYWTSFIGGLVADKSRISVLYNAVPVPPENPYNPDAVNVMFLGAMIKRKGILDLLAAFNLIRGRIPHGCRLVLCGDDPESIVQAETDRLGLSELVELRGWIGAEEKAEVMKASAVNALPSYHEGLPMTILEAMAHGIPCVSTDCAAIPEAVTDGADGLIVKPGDINALADALLRLLTDRETRSEFSKAAWRRCLEDFSLESHNDRLILVYEALLSQKTYKEAAGYYNTKDD